MFGMTMTGSILTMMDTTMVGLISGTYQVGLYTTALKIVKLICNLIAVLSATLLPRCSYHFKSGDMEKFNALMEQGVFVTLFLAVPAVLLVIVNANLIIFILSGSLYMDSVPCIKVLAPIIAFSSLTLLINYQLLLPQGKEKVNLIVLIIGTGIDFILNVILIPNWQAMGACFGTFAAEAVMLCINFFFLLRHLGVKRLFNSSFPIALGTAAFILALNYTPRIEFGVHWNSVIASFFGGFLYVLVICLVCRKRIGALVRRRK